MSDYERVSGTLRKIEVKGENLKEQLDYLYEQGYEFSCRDIGDEYWECDDLKHINNIWYAVIEEINHDDDDCFCDIKKEGNIIKYHTRFYNGGACLDCMLSGEL